MSVAVTSKGQVTIPIAIREALGIDSGSRVEFTHNERGEYVLTPVKKLPKKCEKPLWRFAWHRATRPDGHSAIDATLARLRHRQQ